MNTTNRTICAVALIATLVSCQKEESVDSTSGGGGNSSSIQGTWKFTGLNAKTSVTISGYEPGVGNIKAVTVSEYSTTNNVGTLKIEPSKMISSGIGYSINSVAKAYFYEDNNFVDSVEAPFTFTIPGSSATSNYKMIGQDSVYFEGGGFISISNGTNVPMNPNGAKIKVEGNKLTMTAKISESKTLDTLGVTLNAKTQGMLISTFQKQ